MLFVSGKARHGFVFVRAIADFFLCRFITTRAREQKGGFSL